MHKTLQRARNVAHSYMHACMHISPHMLPQQTHPHTHWYTHTCDYFLAFKSGLFPFTPEFIFIGFSTATLESRIRICNIFTVEKKVSLLCLRLFASQMHRIGLLTTRKMAWRNTHGCPCDPLGRKATLLSSCSHTMKQAFSGGSKLAQ